MYFNLKSNATLLEARLHGCVIWYAVQIPSELSTALPAKLQLLYCAVGIKPELKLDPINERVEKGLHNTGRGKAIYSTILCVNVKTGPLR